MASGDKQPARSWRERTSDMLGWLALIGFLATLPLSFPVLFIYKKLRGEKLRGKGMALLIPLWLGTTSVMLLVGMAYARKGFAGLRILFWIAIAGTIWTIVVLVVIRLIVELIALIVRIRRWFEKRSPK